MEILISKDSNGVILEWDQWSFLMMKNFVGKKKKVDELSIALAKSSLLCSYGTCACFACICEKATKGEFSLRDSYLCNVYLSFLLN